jgi:hypothetical protein
MNRFSTLTAALTTLSAIGAAASGCGLNQTGVIPRQDTIAFPSSAVTDGDLAKGRPGQWLYVVNSNADLRYNDGTLVAINLMAAEEDRATVQPFGQCPAPGYTNPLRKDNGDFCCWDRLDREVLNCDERRYIRRESSVRLGSFGAGMVFQHWECPRLPANADPDAPGTDTCGCNSYTAERPTRLLIAVRGDTSLTVVDLDPPADPMSGEPRTVRCAGEFGTKPPEFHECDDAHRITNTEGTAGPPVASPNPTVVPLPDEPYALTIDYSRGLLYLGHLTGASNRPGTGGVSLFFVQPEGDALPLPRYRGALGMPFPPNQNGFVGVTSLNWRYRLDPDPNDPTIRRVTANEVYATSRYVATASGMTVTESPFCGREGEQEVAIIGAGSSFGSPLTGDQTRGLQFVGDQAFMLQRNPPALIAFSGSTPIALLETCSSPTFLYKFNAYDPTDTHDGPGTRLYISCQDTGEVYVFDPFIPQLEKVFLVGRAPAGLVFAQENRAPNKPVAYVVGFGDNNISVVDLDPTSSSRYHVVQRIGFPSAVPR